MSSKNNKKFKKESPIDNVPAVRASGVILGGDKFSNNLQTQINTKAPLASPALTGTPTVPTATAGTNTTQIASTAFTTNAVASINNLTPGSVLFAGSSGQPTQNNNGFYWDNTNKKLGIGTSNIYSIATCQVQSQSGNSAQFYLTNNDFVQSSSTGSGFYISMGAASGNTFTEFQSFSTGNSTAANLVINPYLGNVGIGTTTVTYPLSIAGNMGIGVVGSGLRVAEGTNAKQGTSTLVGGTVTVSNTSVTANSRIFLTAQSTPSGVAGFLRISARTAGTSFTITSSSALDASVVAWQIFEPY